MSQLLVQNYRNEIERLRRMSRSSTEGVVSEAFKDLLKAWSRQLNWLFVAQYEFQSVQKTRIRPDGTIFHSIGVPFGYWEAKDTADDIDAEIAAKLRRGYPQDNIIFENSQTAVLIQNRAEVFHKAYGRDGRSTPKKAGTEGDDSVISTLVGEMGGSLEGGAKGRDPSALPDAETGGDIGGTAPPSAASGDISPARGEIGRPQRKTRTLTKDDIFAYVYAVLHDPIYRETYALNLKREFPRIPFYPDFWTWAAWGERLVALHIGYETVEPWPLTRTDTADEKARAAGVAPKALLKADRDNGIIRLDTETQLSGIPPEVWTYRLGNRSGLDWILDQYKEKTPKDPTIREKFNTYRFADYKEKVVDLLARVTRVSVETVAIMNAMALARR